jgi:hypothetical protein
MPEDAPTETTEESKDRDPIGEFENAIHKCISNALNELPPPAVMGIVGFQFHKLNDAYLHPLEVEDPNAAD